MSEIKVYQAVLLKALLPLPNFSRLPAISDLPWFVAASSLCLCLYIASSLVVVYFFSSYKDTSHWIWGLP